jgi:hypothetical protein
MMKQSSQRQPTVLAVGRSWHDACMMREADCSVELFRVPATTNLKKQVIES